MGNFIFDVHNGRNNVKIEQVGWRISILILEMYDWEKLLKFQSSYSKYFIWAKIHSHLPFPWTPFQG